MNHPILFFTIFAKMSENRNDFYIVGIPLTFFLKYITLKENGDNWAYSFNDLQKTKSELKEYLFWYIDSNYLLENNLTLDQIYFNLSIYFEKGDNFRINYITISYNRLLKWIES